MKVSTGVDIISIDDIQATLRNPAQLQRMLQPDDITGSTPEHLAGRIALKEAVIKAVGLAPGRWHDIQIRTNEAGKPIVSVTNPPAGLVSLDGSISHHGGMAIGFVVALFDDKDD